MVNKKIPETEIELEKWMIENCYNSNAYSINGSHIWEGFGIEHNGSLYNWYFAERGKREILNVFRTEKEVVIFAYKHIMADRWARSHCIGFLFHKKETADLKKILDEKQIECFQDEIPYSSGEKEIAYRTFVFGCDIKKVDYLKEKYYKH